MLPDADVDDARQRQLGGLRGSRLAAVECHLFTAGARRRREVQGLICHRGGGGVTGGVSGG